ncbi:O-6-methylguanine DNA methyltransferase [Burkholderiales bacterium JOSHI_001]|nr:O-6-methylguanine DNA methyltransferase [Burkholderiales bacterium JOSHI_001]
MSHPYPLVAQCRLNTPLGPMTAAATAAGLAGLWFDGQKHHPGPLDAPQQPQQRWLQAARHTLDRWFEGQDLDAAALALDLHGTAFQRSVWQALLRIPRGSTCSYGTLAQAVGRAAAVRAAAAAVGRNPVSVLVPCHRVLGADGSLTGYAGGLARKQALLALEAQVGVRQAA